MGAFGEASVDLDRVITALAESRVLYFIQGKWKASHRWLEECSARATQKIFLSLVCENSKCLPHSQAGPFLGEGARQAAGRRGYPEMEKRADGEDASVLFFTPSCANFLAVHVQTS